jgi:16S rRNA (uracil1498-N3)-methyltransferase
MNLFYTERSRINPPVLVLDGQEAQHVAKVMRHREGDTIHVTDGEGTIYRCEIRSLTKNSVSAEIQSTEQVPAELPHVTVAIGLIKKRDRLEFALEKCTELGASAFDVFRGDHSEKEKVRTERLEAAVLSAMKQSLRAYLPTVSLSGSLVEVLESAGQETEILMADETETQSGFEKVMTGYNKVLLLIGPEGGFSKKERELIQKRGCKKVSLGNYRLRAETAAIAMTDRLRAGSV